MNEAMTILKASCVLSLLIAVTGCDAPEDEVAGDTSEGFADEASTEFTEEAEFRSDVVENVFCEGGWPGNRVCEWEFGDGRPIDPTSVEVVHKAHAGIGALSYGSQLWGGNILKLTATMHEGKVFDPNQHIALFTVIFNYL
jgi:hypothetical protein